MISVGHRVSLEEFLLLPEEEPALEYDDGVVTQKVSPKVWHSRIQTALAEYINARLAPRRIAMAFAEVRATFAGRSRVPDLSVYRWERMPSDENGLLPEEFFLPPDLVVEIVSPGQSVLQIARRCRAFARDGVGLAILVAPKQRSVLLFRPYRPSDRRRGRQSIGLEEILPIAALSVDALLDTIRIR